MIRAQFLDQQFQFVEFKRSREQNSFLRREVNRDFGLKKLRDLRLPRRQISLGYGRRPIDPHAQRQRVLMLVG